MSRNVSTVKETDTVQAAARLMRDNDIGFLPVVGQDGRVSGTLTDRDITIRAVANGKADAPVREAMTKGVVSCSPADDVSRAAKLMEEEKVSRILCLDESGACVGVISLQNIAQSKPHKLDEVVAEMKTDDGQPSARS